jgi:hypothetical protein
MNLLTARDQVRQASKTRLGWASSNVELLIAHRMADLPRL